MKKLLIIALVSVFATVALGNELPGPPPLPWIGQEVSIEIPVLMDIVPVAELELNGAVIKLEPVSGTVDYVGVADPLPQLRSNVPVTVTALLDPVEPLIAPEVAFDHWGGSGWGVSLQGSGVPHGAPSDNWEWQTSDANYDPAYIGTGVGVPVAVLCVNPDLTQRPQGDDQRVATVVLTVIPRP